MTNKKYIKPEIINFDIDNKISLAMASCTDPGDDPEPMKAHKTEDNNDNPFGEKVFDKK